MTTHDDSRYVHVRLRRPSSPWPFLRLVSVSASIALCVLLVRSPGDGLFAFWDVVIPLLPLVFLLAPGLWRNVCPMAAMNQMPRVAGLTRGFALPKWLERHGYAVAVLLLLGIAGSRKLGLQESAQAAALVVGIALVLPVAGGLVFRGKSGWCGSLCPLRPVQALYAQAPVVKVQNSHCKPCVGCTTNCPDLQPDTAFADDLAAEEDGRGRYRRLFAGAFPGFVLAFYTAPADLAAGPMALRFGLFMLASLGSFFVIDAMTRVRVERVTALYAAVAFGSFYWFNIPVLADAVGRLAGTDLPEWAVWEGRVVMIGIAAGWLGRSARHSRAAVADDEFELGEDAQELPMALEVVIPAVEEQAEVQPVPEAEPVATEEQADPAAADDESRPMAGEPPVPVPDRRSRSRRMRHPEVTFMPGGRRFEVARGTTLLDAARMAGTKLPEGCGMGLCGCDPIYVFSGMESVSAPSREEQATIERLNFPPNTRMACSARVMSDTVVSLDPELGRAEDPEAQPEPAPARAASANGASENGASVNGDGAESPEPPSSPLRGRKVAVDRVVILGNGIAGVTAADHVRRHHGDCEIDLVTDEAHPFYNRTSVSRLIGARSAMRRMYLLPETWYDERRVTSWLNTRATRIDREERKVVLGTGEVLSYDRLILATGSSPLIPEIDGYGLNGTFALRKADDAMLIRSFVQEHECRDAVVAGGGVLGLEAADILRQMGLDVTVVEVADQLAAAQLDVRGADLLHDHIEAAGIEVVLESEVTAVRGRGRVAAVDLDDGSSREADLLIVCAGVLPNAELARDAGLEAHRGVIVDDNMQTSDSAIYAAGDVAEHDGRVYGLWPAAVDQAEAAALNALGASKVYSGSIVPTRLKLTGVDVVSVGDPHADGDGSSEIALEDSERGRYRKLSLRGNSIVGAVLLDHPADAASVGAAIRDRRDVSGDLEALRAGHWEVLNESQFEEAVVAPMARHRQRVASLLPRRRAARDA